MQTEFSRLAIVNRGEAAMRLIHAVREYNRENGTRIKTIALYTEPDRRAMFVREADEAVSLGPATYVDERDGQRKVSYLDYDRLERAFRTSRADSVWVGWGLVAEKADFVDLCDRLGLTFLGPTADVMRRLGDKITAKLLAEKSRVPVARWSGGPVDTVEEAHAHGERLGYPLVIKATSGGGGRGIRVVTSDAEVEEAFKSARSEAGLAFGDPTVFMEKMVGGARHVEVQVIGDTYGNVWSAGVRDCSVQRRNQKVLEEAPSPALSPEQDEFLREAARRLTHEAGYSGAGTVEFLYDVASKQFAFMEVNARLQVEHPVTELTTGLDMVKLQIHVARGGKLEGAAPVTVGHAIEARLNAENPDDNFAPAPGLVELFRVPTGPGVRVDTGIAQGDQIAPEFDSMVAKILAWGRDREEALARLTRALGDTTVVLRGGTTNRSFLLNLLRLPEVQTSDLDNKWLDVLSASGQHVARDFADVALLQAAIDAYDEEFAAEQASFHAWARRGRPQVRAREGFSVDLRYRGQNYGFTVYRLGATQYRVVGEGVAIDVGVERLSVLERRLTCFNRRFRVVAMGDELGDLVEVNDVTHRITRDDGGAVRSPAPAVVVSTLVQQGDEVAIGDPLVVIEAMKMEMRITSPVAGRIKGVPVSGGVQVQAGAPLVYLEAAAVQEVPTGERVVLGQSGAEVPEVAFDAVCGNVLDALRREMLGFDIDPADAGLISGEQLTRCSEAAPADPSLLRGEDEILNTFVDICSLVRRRPELHELVGEELQSSEEYLFTYLLSLDRGTEGLPQWFLENLKRTLAHYGVDSLDRSPQLEESLFWIYRSQQRMGEQVPVIMSILDRRLENADQLAPMATEEFRALLDRMVRASQHRFQAVADLAREVAYRYFDQAIFDRARDAVYHEMEELLDYLEQHPEARDREERIRLLVQCPQPLKNLLTSRYGLVSLEQRRLMLEVLTRRYYRIRNLQNLRTIVTDGRAVATGEYDYEGRRLHVFTTFSDYDTLEEGVGRLEPLVGQVPEDHDVLFDLYVWRPGQQAEPDVTAREVGEVVNSWSFSRPIRRVVVAVTGPGRGLGTAGTQHFTYRRRPEGLVEDEMYRGLHPMMGKRLALWRLQNFSIQRLPSVEDVYLFRGVAHENPRDERLFALAEVRDLTPVRDDSGRVTQLPHLERMLMEALAGIRLYQSHLPEGKRLQWNRVLLYVWPVFDLTADELHDVVYRLTPATEGLGLEKVDVLAQMPDPRTHEPRDTVLSISNPLGKGVVLRIDAPVQRPISPLTDYRQKVVQMRRRGLVYPYEIIGMMTPAQDGGIPTDFPPGDFVEYDFDSEGRFVPVDRPWGQNTANVVVGVIRNFVPKQPEGMNRMIILGDPSRGLGSLAEPECSRVIAAIDLAEERGIPVEWFTLSSGAKISMTSGVENLDWTARTLRRVITFTQGGGEVNLIVNGINVGAQSYWNAEATMLMHTNGILVMTPDGAMVLTGKQALDYSGGVSADDNLGIGGYDRVMGPNGEAQYWAPDLAEACRILFRHYEHSYVVPGERFPRRAVTGDPPNRDIRTFPHPQNGVYDFKTVGQVLSDEYNPGRKKPFDVRTVMASCIDQGSQPLERWAGMRDADTGVVWDAHIGGYPVCLMGFESHQIQRRGIIPADGPEQWTSGTLFPLSSKKIARGINAASGNRPAVFLANLSGFDGSPEAMRNLQLEFGAEIGRAVVNFMGPMSFCVISRYHGGAFVVFSNTLNDNLEVAAVEGSYASVIGGAPAAAVVFAREVDTRTNEDPRVKALEAQVAAASGAEKAKLRNQLSDVRKSVRSEKLTQVAEEFDAIHSVQRAQKMGSVHRIVPAAELRPYLIDAIERGMARELARIGAGDGHGGKAMFAPSGLVVPREG